MPTAFRIIGVSADGNTKTIDTDNYDEAFNAYVKFINGSNTTPPDPEDWPYPYYSGMYAWNGEIYTVSQSWYGAA